MLPKLPRRLGLLVAVMMLMAVGPLAGEAAASHFRHGNVNWKKVAGAPAGQQRITVQYEQSWRASAFGNPSQGDVISNGEGCISWGDGGTTCPQYLVEFVNNAEDYIRIQALAPGSTTDINVPHDYADPAGTFNISTTSCCTISTLNNANDATWNILSTVNLAAEDESAVSTIPAIVTLAPGGVRTFNIPAGDAGGETLFFRLSTAAEGCAGCADPHPPGISVNSSTGQMSLNTTGLDGLNWTGVVIESRNAQGAIVATSHIQFIINVGAGGATNQPPVWDSPPTPADGTEFTVVPGTPLNCTLQASDPDRGDTVSILQNSGPGTFTPTNGNPATGAFSYTATAADLGQDYIVQFIAQDPSGAGPPFRSFTIKVRSTGATQGGAAGDCVPPAKKSAAAGTLAPPTVAESCVRRAISLVRAAVRRNTVVLRGLVQPKYAGRQVTILANSAGATTALKRLTVVRSNAAGEFRATIRRPKGRKGLINARYKAQVSRFRSIALKLPQSLSSRSVKQVGGQIEVRGKVKRSLLGRRNTVTVKRLVCGRYRTVGRAKPDRNGNYVVRFNVPANVSVALFRAESRVLNKAGSRRYVKQYARAVSITLTSQTG